MIRIDENGNVFINGKHVNEYVKDVKPEIKSSETSRRVVIRNGKVIKDEVDEMGNQDLPPQFKNFDKFNSITTKRRVVINGKVVQDDIITNDENFNEEEFKKEIFEDLGELVGLNLGKATQKENDFVVEKSLVKKNEVPVYENFKCNVNESENPKLIRCDFCGNTYKRRKKKCPHCGAKDGII